MDEPSTEGDFWSTPNYLAFPEDYKNRNIENDYRPKTCPNPYWTVIRGVAEECSRSLAGELKPENVYFVALGWDDFGFNPHLYAVVRAPISGNALAGYLASGDRDNQGETNPFVVPFTLDGELRALLRGKGWAEHSKAAVLKALAHEYGQHDAHAGLSQSGRAS
jgi:hypothetical protein